MHKKLEQIFDKSEICRNKGQKGWLWDTKKAKIRKLVLQMAKKEKMPAPREGGGILLPFLGISVTNRRGQRYS